MSKATRDFLSIYDEFYPRILRYLTQMAGESEAEDLTQEVFVKVSEALEGFRGESQLSTWIYRIATHVAMDRYRRTAGTKGQQNTLTIDDIASSEENRDLWTGEAVATSEEQVIRNEMNGCIREMVNTLPDAYRAVLVLSDIEKLKDSEIASILGLTLQATKIRLHRARTKLKETLSSSCVFYRNNQNELACDRKAPLVNIETAKFPSTKPD